MKVAFGMPSLLLGSLCPLLPPIFGGGIFSVCANYCYVIKYLDDVIYWNDLEARDCACCILMLGNFRNKVVAM